MTQTADLLLVGNPEISHIGAHFTEASRQLGISVFICDSNLAFQAPFLVTKANWWLRGHRPTHLYDFSNYVLRTCRNLKPRWLLATGIAPITAEVLSTIGRMGVVCLNFLTDDPWNPAHRADWFLKALPYYNQVFSPRRSNLKDLESSGCRQVTYMPFAYAPSLHFPEVQANTDDARCFVSDVMFAGGADHDRVGLLEPLIAAGFDVGLYGSYWGRFRKTRAHNRGHAAPAALRNAVAHAKICLCLVRRANRDGHVMRSFEIPAMAGCMLTEYTPDHVELFGQDGQAVMYFRTSLEMVDKAHWLLNHPAERERLAKAAHTLIVQGHHTYTDRLKALLGISGAEI